MLYVGAAAPLSVEDGAAAQALADAFEVAYARYDDFQRLEAQKRAVEAALTELRTTQQQLVQSEKLASLGALTAGIAHEIKNPLNFVNNFASLSRQIAAQLAEELEGDSDPALIQELLEDLQANTQRIETHGRRADSIVRGMMQHARDDQGQREPVDLNALVDSHVNLAFHGRRAQVPDFNVTIERDFADDAGEVEVVSQEIGRVLINLVTNAFDAVSARAAAEPAGYAPTVRVATARTARGVEVRVEDNGTGIPEDIRERVFDPFFTTKPTGQGTGLGLSMSHHIVELGHGGRLTVQSEPGEGATFTVELPE
jgi:signal transduction histidine kinase